MESRKYKYTGTTEVELQGYGLVKPNQIVEVDFVVTHPNFQKEVDKKKEDKD